MYTTETTKIVKITTEIVEIPKLNLGHVMSWLL